MSLRVVAFDLDGVIYRGTRLLPGAGEAVEAATRAGLAVRYVTNNATAHRRTVAARLRVFGLPADVDQVLSSAAATAAYLCDRLGCGASVMVVGEQGLLEELTEAGLRVRHAREEGGDRAGAPAPAVDALVVGLDRTFTYDTLAAAQAAVLGGAVFVATNADATYPAEDRVLPGGGALVAAVATAAGRSPVVIGKPEIELARSVAASGGAALEEVLFVGDRLDTDIAMARRAGMVSALVMTGVTTPDDLRAARTEGRRELLPDHVLVDLTGLPDLMARLTSAVGG